VLQSPRSHAKLGVSNYYIHSARKLGRASSHTDAYAIAGMPKSGCDTVCALSMCYWAANYIICMSSFEYKQFLMLSDNLHVQWLG
jgi:hypothetical protein